MSNQTKLASNKQHEMEKLIALTDVKNSKKGGWLSCKLEIQNFDLKNQTFEITGEINTYWKWPNYEKLKKEDGFGSFIEYIDVKDSDIINENDQNKEYIDYKDKDKDNTSHAFQKFIESFKGFMKKDKDFQYRKERIAIRKDKDHELNNYQIKNLFDIEIKFLHLLPVDPKFIFYEASIVDIEHTAPPLLYYNKKTGNCNTFYKIAATLFEPLELYSFPFDFQFLNIQIRWNSGRYLLYEPDKNGVLSNNEMISQIEDTYYWWHKKIKQIDLMDELSDKQKKEEKDSIPITKKKQLVTVITQKLDIIMLQPWLYFGDHVWIRLRIKRDPMYYVTTSLFPVFMIVLCSFATFEFEAMEDSLNYAITVLLTFVAGQGVIIDQLPETSQMLYAHYYIWCGYFIQLLTIGWAISKDYPYVHEAIFRWFIISIWLFATALYLILWFKIKWCVKDHKKKEKYRWYPKWYKNVCYCQWMYCRSIDDSWSKREREEREEFKKEETVALQYKKEQMGDVYYKDI